MDVRRELRAIVGAAGQVGEAYGSDRRAPKMEAELERRETAMREYVEGLQREHAALRAERDEALGAIAAEHRRTRERNDWDGPCRCVYCERHRATLTPPPAGAE